MLAKIRRPFSLLWLTWGLYFLALFSRYLFRNEHGLFVGHEHAWADWPMHLSMVKIFALKPPSEWFVYHPLYADGRLIYTFLANLISSLFLRMGFSLPLSFVLPSLITMGALLWGLYRLGLRLLGDGWTALLAISLFFLNSGLGSVFFVRDFLRSPSFSQLLFPTLHYSRMNDFDWYSGNVVVGLLAPQRSCLLGFCLGIWVLVLLVEHLRGPGSLRSLALAGALGGLLPVAHMHSFIVVALLAACLWSGRILPLFRRSGTATVSGEARLRSTLGDAAFFFSIFLGLAGLLFRAFLWNGFASEGFLRWHPGFSAGSFGKWLYFWFMAWGLTLPLALLETVRWFREREDNLRPSLTAGFWAVFVLGNLFLFQAVVWDNAKLFLWSEFGFSCLVGSWMARFFRTRVGSDRGPLSSSQRRAAAALAGIGLLLCATGVLELIRVQRIDRNAMELVTEREILLGDQILAKTETQARFLTANSHNHYVMSWAARPILMGFPPYAANFGFPTETLEKEIALMFAGDATAPELLRKNRISYVHIGPYERGGLKVNEAYFKSRFPVLVQDSEKTVYDVRVLLK